jgi:hypothetical protein
MTVRRLAARVPPGIRTRPYAECGLSAVLVAVRCRGSGKPPPGQAGAGAGDRFVPAAQLARTGAALGAPAADFCFCSRHGNRSVKTRKPSPASSRAKPMTIANFATFSAK